MSDIRQPYEGLFWMLENCRKNLTPTCITTSEPYLIIRMRLLEVYPDANLIHCSNINFDLIKDNSVVIFDDANIMELEYMDEFLKLYDTYLKRNIFIIFLYYVIGEKEVEDINPLVKRYTFPITFLAK